MKLLLTNDDGYKAPGIRGLKEELSLIHEVTVVAPESERSGFSAAMTLARPLKYNLHEQGVYSIAGTPADCAHLALRHFMKRSPDVVVSGINRGPNLGDDTLFSGTVGAANVACLDGVSAIAVSMGDFNEPMYYSTGAKVVARLLNVLNFSDPALVGRVINVNVPNLPLKDIKGIRQTRLSRRYYPRHFDEDRDQPDNHLWYGRGPVTHDELPDSDATAIEQGYVSVTLLRPHLLDERVFPGGLDSAMLAEALQ